MRIQKLTDLILKKDKREIGLLIGEVMAQSEITERCGRLYQCAGDEELAKDFYRKSAEMAEVAWKVTKTFLDEIEKDSPIIKPTSGPLR